MHDMYVSACLAQCTCEGQRTSCRSQFFPSTQGVMGGTQVASLDIWLSHFFFKLRVFTYPLPQSNLSWIDLINFIIYCISLLCLALQWLPKGMRVEPWVPPQSLSVSSTSLSQLAALASWRPVASLSHPLKHTYKSQEQYISPDPFLVHEPLSGLCFVYCNSKPC